MLQKLKAKKNFLIATFRKKSLRRNVLFLSLSGVVLTFLVMMITAPMFLYFIQNLISERGNKWGEHTANLAEKLYHDQTKAHLREIVGVQSNLINKNLMALADDVEDISKSMEEILKNQSQYRPRYLPNPRDEQIPFGKAYLHFNQRTLGNLPPDVMEKLYVASNIEDVIVAVTADNYSVEHSHRLRGGGFLQSLAVCSTLIRKG